MARKIQKLEPFTDEKFRGIYAKADGAKVSAAAARVDQSAIITEEDARYTAELWDGSSDINGVSPVVVRKKFNIKPDTACYLVRDTEGKVIVFQPFKPGVGGSQPMTRSEAEDYSQDARQNMVNSRATQRIMRALAEGLKAD